MKKLAAGVADQQPYLQELQRVNKAIQTLQHASRLRSLRQNNEQTEDSSSNQVDLGHNVWKDKVKSQDGLEAVLEILKTWGECHVPVSQPDTVSNTQKALVSNYNLRGLEQALPADCALREDIL